MKSAIRPAASALLLMFSSASHGFAEDDRTVAAAGYVRAHIMPWINDPVVIAAIKAQNIRHKDITQIEIKTLDAQWKQEVEAPEKPLVDSVLNNDASQFLQDRQARSGGVIAEIFVTDDKGLNVAESDATSDYWQADEDKFQKTFGAGSDAVLIEEPDKDASTRQYQIQASFTLKDETGKPIGIVSTGLNVSRLLSQR